jgi:hypothetical protein
MLRSFDSMTKPLALTPASASPWRIAVEGPQGNGE